MRKLIGLVLLLGLVVVGAYVAAGYAAGPSLQIAAPEKYVGISTPLEVVVDTPGGRLSSLTIEFEQRGTRTTLFSGADSILGDKHVTREGPDRLHVKTIVGRESVKGLKSGQGRILVTAVRPVGYGIRRIQSDITRDVEVRLERPKVSVLSTKHYINAGGSEMIIYRATPEGVMSGVSVGDVEYPGYPASGLDVAGMKIAEPAAHVAFFALRYDQKVNAPMRLFARDEAGNSATAEFDHRSFPKQFKASRIPLDDKFLERAVPAVLAETTDVKPGASTIESFLAVNGELRRKNAAQISALAAHTAPAMLWGGEVFHQFSNTAVESAFADRRTYLYKGREVDRQTHLGFDLASFANTPIVAANRGRVAFADNLGIYGNCVIIDHGMGVQSLYAHLSSIDVKAGAMVEKEAPIGRSGMTGLAAGDHLHFTMLVNGQMVNPIEWWDPHWIEDRVLRKLREVR